jgi:dephospho-CoA kinase
LRPPIIKVHDARPDIFVVALTGGIASGKTTVSHQFSALGVAIIDTDLIAHEIVEPGQPALQQVVDSFGREFTGPDGRLERHKLRSAIFADPMLKQQLESILHPRIATEAKKRVYLACGPYCIVVIPLYAESAGWNWIDRVLVVDVDESTQVKRVMKRDKIGRDEARAILAAQATRLDRLAMADDVIDNSGNMEGLQTQIEALHAKYLALASARQAGNVSEGRSG